ncbi:MAG: hypothetical protein ACOYB3_01150 [Azonexus sp.]
MTSTATPQSLNECNNTFSALWYLLKMLGKYAILLFAIMAACWIVVGMAAAVVVMVLGVIQAINAEKNGEEPLVTNKCLFTVFYLFAIPITFFLYFLAAAWGEDCAVYAVDAYRITAMFTAYLLLRYKLLPLLMRHSSKSVHAHAGWILAILMWPVYGPVLYYCGVPMMIYDLAAATLEALQF